AVAGAPRTDGAGEQGDAADRVPARPRHPWQRARGPERGGERRGECAGGAALARKRRQAPAESGAAQRGGRAARPGQWSGYPRNRAASAVFPVFLGAWEHRTGSPDRPGPGAGRRRRPGVHRPRSRTDDLPLYLSGGVRVNDLQMITDRVEPASRTTPRIILLVEDEPDARTILARRLQAF